MSFFKTKGGFFMYFPYLRGRQFDLIACRELIEESRLSERVIPIIEPVKASSTLRSTLQTFVTNNREIAVIQNPSVGEYLSEFDELNQNDIEAFETLMNSEYIIPAFLMENEDTLRQSIQRFSETYRAINYEDIIIIHNNPTLLESHINLFSQNQPLFTLTPDHILFRRRINNNRIIFEDRFTPEQRNADYNNRDIFFSNDHLYYEDEQCEGFSDFSIVSSNYVESGFAPLAVAFHIIYPRDNNDLYVKSFVSDSNDDIRDPAGKYYQALTKLNNWELKNDNRIQTLALSIFLEHFEAGSYPGLGTVKKLSIMHHIELISNYLEGMWGS